MYKNESPWVYTRDLATRLLFYWEEILKIALRSVYWREFYFSPLIPPYLQLVNIEPGLCSYLISNFIHSLSVLTTLIALNTIHKSDDSYFCISCPDLSSWLQICICNCRRTSLLGFLICGPDLRAFLVSSSICNLLSDLIDLFSNLIRNWLLLITFPTTILVWAPSFFSAGLF